MTEPPSFDRPSRSSGRRRDLTDRLGRLLFATIWFAIIVLLAFGSAGIVAGMDHLPGGPGRPELTWAGDEAIRPGLDAATGELASISVDVDRLGVLGRGALAALAGREFETLDRTIQDGGALIAVIRDRTARLRASLASLPGIGVGAELRLSTDTLDRRARLIEALDTTDGLAVDWARLTDGAASAARLSTLLTQHDQFIIAAIQVARDGSLKTAIARVEKATAALAEAETLRDRLQSRVDVTTLSEWLRRNRAYDTALHKLYVASLASPGRVTDAVREALREEAAARRQLPADTSGLVIIMAEIGRGGLNEAVIAIEGARGRLAAALDALSLGRPIDEGTEPTVEPSPSASPLPQSSPSASP